MRIGWRTAERVVLRTSGRFNSVLLERIAAEKTRLMTEKKLQEPKTLPPIGTDAVPFAVPEE